MASDSRCLSRVERSNASLIRKFVKLLASLKLPIKAVLSQAVINHNLQPSKSLGGHCPAELHYTRPRSILAHIFKPIPTPKNRGALKSMHEQEMATTLMEWDSIVEAVKRFQSRRKKDNPLSNRHRLQKDDFVIKKRTSFHQSIAKKYQNLISNIKNYW
jgi:hypothetical protein